MKFCKDCKHFYGREWCSRAMKTEPVLGLPDTSTIMSARSQRYWPSFLGFCGKQGRFWMPKEKRSER